MAETAGGKTEAAFLPILSAIAEEPPGSIRVLYVGPLKALINDQFGRLEELCENLNVPVHRWHGDVDAGRKARVTKDPAGVLLITPESIESLLINRSAHLGHMFGGLRAIVIDELHAFLDSSRGIHLASVLTRLRRYVAAGEPRPRLVGLSATIGDPSEAQRYLDKHAPDAVQVIDDPHESKELRMALHYYQERRPTEGSESNGRESEESDHFAAIHLMACDLVEHCHGRTNLVFCNAKGEIEIIADECNEVCKGEGLPGSFLVHHGSLSQEIREDTEDRMRSSRPFTTICSSTLEMGIDIGDAYCVGQVGAPWSVTSLKQRMGRSGRRDDAPRRLRLYVRDDSDPDARDPTDRLPFDLLQTVAVCELMLRDHWLEPPQPPKCDLSTLTHQMISVIAEWGGIRADALFNRLCAEGPFEAIGKGLFECLLRELGQQDVINQAPEGDIILGLLGERIRSGRDFYAVFETPEEYRLVHDGKDLGTLPAALLPQPESHIVFGGRRWIVVIVDAPSKTIHVKPARGRKRPLFLGAPGDVPDRVRERMRELLIDPPSLSYLSEEAQDRLSVAAASAREAHLLTRGFMPTKDDSCLIVTWSGTRTQRTLLAALSRCGIETIDLHIGIRCKAATKTVEAALKSLTSDFPTGEELAPYVARPINRKFDWLLSDQLRHRSIGVDLLDPSSARELVVEFFHIRDGASECT